MERISKRIKGHRCLLSTCMGFVAHAHTRYGTHKPMNELVEKWREFRKEWEADRKNWREVSDPMSETISKKLFKPDFFDFMEWLALNQKPPTQV